MDFEVLDDRELFEKLEKAALAEKLTTSADWKLLVEVMKRAADRWTEYFVTKVDSRNISDVEMVRAMIRVYRGDFLKGLEILRQEGEIVFEELKYRGKLRQPSEPFESDVEHSS